jgi:ribulose-5-phosphate 4-epimerase/fuculose-1-phosphate aldolase
LHTHSPAGIALSVSIWRQDEGIHTRHLFANLKQFAERITIVPVAPDV